MIIPRAPRPRARGAALALLVALGVAACGGGGDEDEAAAAPRVAARTAVVTLRPFTETLDAIGTVAARPGHVATLAAPAPARVARVEVAVGQRVAPGTVLVVFDQTGFVAAEHAADAALAAAERSAERTRRLVDEGIAPRKDLDQATAELAQAQANAATARRAEVLSVLRSPIAGVVTQLQATLGAMVDPAQPLVSVADPTQVDVVFNVTPGDAARVHPGADVTLRAGQSATGEPLGHGTVVDVGGAVDTVSRSVAVRARIPAARRPLRIGETIFGQIAVRTVPGAVVVPLAALVPEGDAFQVFVVDPAGVAHARRVTVGARADSVAEITSGLAVGERIVTQGAYGVEDSARVVPLGAPASGRPAPEAP